MGMTGPDGQSPETRSEVMTWNTASSIGGQPPMTPMSKASRPSHPTREIPPPGPGESENRGLDAPFQK